MRRPEGRTFGFVFGKDVGMHRKQGTARPRALRTVLTVNAAIACLALTAAIACLALTAGCSGHGPAPEDQREEMVAATTAVIENLVSVTDASGPAVLNDATAPVGCGDGQQYQYVAYARTTYEAGTDIDTRLDDLSGLVVGASAGVPQGGDYYAPKFTSLELDLDGGGPRQYVFAVEQGTGTGSTLTVDLVSDGAEEILIRVAGATACG